MYYLNWKVIQTISYWNAPCTLLFLHFKMKWCIIRLFKLKTQAGFVKPLLYLTTYHSWLQFDFLQFWICIKTLGASDYFPRYWTIPVNTHHWILKTLVPEGIRAPRAQRLCQQEQADRQTDSVVREKRMHMHSNIHAHQSLYGKAEVLLEWPCADPGSPQHTRTCY